jgi:AraC-like DNA-binding protein
MNAVHPAERIEISRPAALPGVGIMVVEHSTRRWRVFHENYSIGTVLDASGSGFEWSYRGKTHYTEAKNVTLIEPGEVHVSMKVKPATNFRVLYVDPSLLARQAKEMAIASSTPHFRFANITDPALFRAFALLHASLENGTNTLEQQSRYVASMRLLLERCAENAPNTELRQSNRLHLFRARDFIWEYYAENITLDELHTLTGLSRFHLLRAFAKEFGVPPHTYLDLVRLAKARKFIAKGIPLAIVAAEVGFADQSHLNRHFVKTYGITPATYAGNKRKRSSINYVAPEYLQTEHSVPGRRRLLANKIPFSSLLLFLEQCLETAITF